MHAIIILLFLMMQVADATMVTRETHTFRVDVKVSKFVNSSYFLFKSSIYDYDQINFKIIMVDFSFIFFFLNQILMNVLKNAIQTTVWEALVSIFKDTMNVCIAITGLL